MATRQTFHEQETATGGIQRMRMTWRHVFVHPHTGWECIHVDRFNADSGDWERV